MKILALFLLIGASFLLFSCDKGLNEITVQNDRLALQSMESSFSSEILFNDSLATYISESGISNDENCHYLDSMFHSYDSVFVAYHELYSHHNSGDDHGSGSWMMGHGMTDPAMIQRNNMMMGGQLNTMINEYGFNTRYCTWQNLALMDSLMDAHEQYHPGN